MTILTFLIGGLKFYKIALKEFTFVV